MKTPEKLSEEFRQLQSRLQGASGFTGPVLQELLRSIEAVRGMSVLKSWYDEQRGSLERALQAANLDIGLAQKLPENPFESQETSAQSQDATATLSDAVDSLETIVRSLERWVDDFGTGGSKLAEEANAIQERVLRSQAGIIQSVQASKKEFLGEPEPPTPEPSDERRDSGPRIAVEVPVSLESDTRFYYGSSENASSSGVFVATPFTMPEGTSVSLNLLFPGDEVLTTEGTVAWVRAETEDSPSGMGVRLTDINPYLEQRLQTLLKTTQED